MTNKYTSLEHSIRNVVNGQITESVATGTQEREKQENVLRPNSNQRTLSNLERKASIKNKIIDEAMAAAVARVATGKKQKAKAGETPVDFKPDLHKEPVQEEKLPKVNVGTMTSHSGKAAGYDPSVEIEHSHTPPSDDPLANTKEWHAKKRAAEVKEKEEAEKEKNKLKENADCPTCVDGKCQCDTVQEGVIGDALKAVAKGAGKAVTAVDSGVGAVGKGVKAAGTAVADAAPNTTAAVKGAYDTVKKTVKNTLGALGGGGYGYGRYRSGNDDTPGATDQPDETKEKDDEVKHDDLKPDTAARKPFSPAAAPQSDAAKKAAANKPKKIKESYADLVKDVIEETKVKIDEGMQGPWSARPARRGYWTINSSTPPSASTAAAQKAVSAVPKVAPTAAAPAAPAVPKVAPTAAAPAAPAAPAVPKVAPTAAAPAVPKVAPAVTSGIKNAATAAAPAVTSGIKNAATAAAPAVAKAGASLAGRAIPVLGAAADYAARRSEGQSHLRAGLGAAASTLGGIGGAALGSGLASVPLAIGGAIGAGKAFDYVADKVAGPVTPPKPEGTTPAASAQTTPTASSTPAPAAPAAAAKPPNQSVNTQLAPSAINQKPVNTNDKAVNTVKTGGGNYNVYNKNSDTAASFRDQYAQAKKAGAGQFKWTDASGKENVYGTGVKGGKMYEPVKPEVKAAAGAPSGNVDIDKKTQAIASGESPAEAAQANRDAGRVMGNTTSPKDLATAAAAAVPQADKDQMAINNAETGRDDGTHKSVVGTEMDPKNIKKVEQDVAVQQAPRIDALNKGAAEAQKIADDNKAKAVQNFGNPDDKDTLRGQARAALGLTGTNNGGSANPSKRGTLGGALGGTSLDLNTSAPKPETPPPPPPAPKPVEAPKPEQKPEQKPEPVQTEPQGTGFAGEDGGPTKKKKVSESALLMATHMFLQRFNK